MSRFIKFSYPNAGVKYEDFLDTGYRPGRDDIICLFRIIPAAGFTFEETAARIASESSNGTWAELDVPQHVRKLSAVAFELKPPYAKIAYPLGLFELGSIPQALSSIAGNIFGMKAARSVRLEDISWPKAYLRSFRGPQFGIPGVRKLLGIPRRPILASVPKPKVGLTTREFSAMAAAAWRGGVDLLKDDENLTDQAFNRFERRLDACMKLRRTIERETGERKSYLLNITAETQEMLRRARLAAKLGNEYVMVDILTAGWAAVQTVREECEKLGLAIHAHRAFHAAIDRNPAQGMSMKILAEIARIQGCDQVHIGGLGKLAGDRREVRGIWEKVALQSVGESKEVLAQDWAGMKPLLGTCSGGLHPGIISRLVRLLGADIVIQAGGGIHGHPRGTEAGARAMRAALDAIADGHRVEDAARVHPELADALAFWGHGTPK